MDRPSALPRPKSSYSLRNVSSSSSIKSNREATQLPTVTRQPSTRFGFAKGQAGLKTASLVRQPSLRLREVAQAFPPAAAPRNAMQAEPAELKRAGSASNGRRLVPSRSILQLPSLRPRASPKANIISHPLAGKRIVSTTSTKRGKASSTGSPHSPIGPQSNPLTSAKPGVTFPRPSTTIPSPPVLRSTTSKPTLRFVVESPARNVPLTPARRPIPMPVTETPLLPRLVSQPWPAVTEGLIKDIDMSFGEEGESTQTAWQSPLKKPNRAAPPTIRTELEKVRLDKEFVQKERDDFRTENMRLQEEMAKRSRERIIRDAERALQEEEALLRLIRIAKSMVDSI